MEKTPSPLLLLTDHKLLIITNETFFHHGEKTFQWSDGGLSFFNVSNIINKRDKNKSRKYFFIKRAFAGFSEAVN